MATHIDFLLAVVPVLLGHPADVVVEELLGCPWLDGHPLGVGRVLLLDDEGVHVLKQEKG